MCKGACRVWCVKLQSNKGNRRSRQPCCYCVQNAAHPHSPLLSTAGSAENIATLTELTLDYGAAYVAGWPGGCKCSAVNCVSKLPAQPAAGEQEEQQEESGDEEEEEEEEE